MPLKLRIAVNIINVGGSPSPNGRTGEIVVNLAQPSNTPEEIQIKFGDNHASGQLTIDVNQQSGLAKKFPSTSTAAIATINLCSTCWSRIRAVRRRMVL